MSCERCGSPDTNLSVCLECRHLDELREQVTILKAERDEARRDLAAASEEIMRLKNRPLGGEPKPASDENLSEIARMRAGLSIGQAAKFTGIDRDDLIRIERAETIDADVVPKLCDVYAVRPEWITGEVPRYDYAALDKIKGADDLPTSDRDTIAEFAASMPRAPQYGASAKERLAEIAEKKKRSDP